MKSLSTLLMEFDGTGLNVDQLTEKFKEIAKAAIYGGYFRVNDEFDIHIVDIEFYFHSENKEISTVFDWAMYHRNDKGRKVDYFPIGSLHPHKSGVDVTFEKEGKYRAGFLIRKYEIVENGKVTPLDQPSYLREDLFGYAGFICDEGPNIKPNIRWESIKDIETKDSNEYYIVGGPRIRVGAYDNNGNRIKGQFDKREWRFTNKK